MGKMGAFIPGAPLLIVVLLGHLPEGARAQQPGDEIREDALRVFLDCNTFPCSSDYFRTEVAFVNWVRDRTLAQVHLIITGTQTGGGGREFGLDFVGLQELEGRDDRLTFTALGTDTQDEILSALSRVIAAGFARYSTLIGQLEGFEISAAERLDVDTDLLPDHRAPAAAPAQARALPAAAVGRVPGCDRRASVLA